MRFSILIPVKAINDYVRETVPYVQKLRTHPWELIIVTNEPEESEWNDPRIRMISSGRVGPADKRDQAAKTATGDVLVFLDDDAYPEPDILEIAERYFQDPTVVAIGGPARTPPSDSFWQRVSGTVFLSRFAGGSPERYVPIGGAREIDDWPSVNMMVRKADFLAVGGFQCAYWPGEDTKLCLELKGTRKRMLYVPEMIVWHHRRAGLWAHMKQVGGYGLHRGFFARHHPQNSRKIGYFIPSAFVLFVGLTALNRWLPGSLQSLIALGWMGYAMGLVLAWKDFMKYETFPIACCGLCYTFFTHLAYGVRFMQGLFFTRDLVSQLR